MSRLSAAVSAAAALLIVAGFGYWVDGTSGDNHPIGAFPHSLQAPVFPMRLTPAVFTVKEGMTKVEVRKLAGTPWREGSRCWVYREVKPATNIVGMRFCFTRERVTLVETSLHL